MTYELPTTTLGRTGLTVTRLGIGGAYCETPDGYRAALDCGVNYLDTSPLYRDGDDERVIGEALAGRRDQIVLATKTQKRDAKAAREELETSLRLLRTDHLDLWQFHYLTEPDHLDQILAPGGAMEAADKARDQGLVRFIGVTSHQWDLLVPAVATGLFDTVLCWYNCGMREPEEKLFPEAVAQRMGVIIMQSTRADQWLSPDDVPALEDYYRFVLSHPAVSVVLRGLRSVELFERAARGLSERITIEPEEQQRLEAYCVQKRAEDPEPEA